LLAGHASWAASECAAWELGRPGGKRRKGRAEGKEQAGAGLPAATGQKREEEFFSILFPTSNPNANPIKFEHGLKYIFCSNKNKQFWVSS